MCTESAIDAPATHIIFRKLLMLLKHSFCMLNAKNVIIRLSSRLAGLLCEEINSLHASRPFTSPLIPNHNYRCRVRSFGKWVCLQARTHDFLAVLSQLKWNQMVKQFEDHLQSQFVHIWQWKHIPQSCCHSSRVPWWVVHPINCGEILIAKIQFSLVDKPSCTFLRT